MEAYEQMLKAVAAIRSDEDLKQSFIQILKYGPYTQQGRVQKVLEVVEQQGAPEEVVRFLKLLKNDKLAQLFLNALEKPNH